MDIYPLLFSYLSDDLQVHHSYSQCIAAPVRLHPLYVAKCALRDSLYKKLVPRDDSELESVAVDGFRRSNARCASWTPIEPGFLNRVRSRITDILAPWQETDWVELLTESHLLPCSGASVMSRGQNSTFEKLFVNTWTYTDKALVKDLMLCYARWNPLLLHAERIRRARSRDPLVQVTGSSLSTVPKNSATNRTICTEPGVNMLYQRALGECINHALKLAFGYDSASQPDRNRRQARYGVDHQWATIDLQSASDSISMQLCEYILPDWLMLAINDCRSPTTTYMDEVIPLHMVSSMGNGFTFPLQTLIFTAVVQQAMLDSRVPVCRFTDEQGFGVFGDDIICPSRVFDVVCQRLTECGFIVNHNKSFSTGLFRESCGHDYYDGVDVRGVYLKSLNHDADVYSAINRLVRWGVKHGVYLTRSVPYLVSQVSPLYVPNTEADTAGIHTPYAIGRKKYNFSYRILSPRRTKFKFFREAPVLANYRHRKGLKPLQNRDLGYLRESHNNPVGFVFALLLEAWPCEPTIRHFLDISEVVSRCETERRSRGVQYRVEKRTTPIWGTPIALGGNVNYQKWSNYHDCLWSLVG